MTSEELNVWRARIQRAEGVQQKQHTIWKQSLELYNCEFFDNIYGGFDPERVDVHFANWFINNTIPLTYFRDPFNFVKSRSDAYSAFAATMEEVVNLAWRELELKQQFKRVILSACLMPPGWIKIGYTAKIGQDISKIEAEKQKNLIETIKATITGVFKEKKELTPEEQGVLNEYIEEESIFVNWVSSWKMLISEGYHLISDMPYIIEIEDIPKIDFEANPLYKNKDKATSSKTATISPSATLHKPSYKEGSTTDDELQTIKLYHIQDRRTRSNYTISNDDVHYEAKWPASKDYFDYIPLMFDETLPSKENSNPYPVNLLRPILPQIIEQSRARTQMVKWRKRASTIILVQKGLATEEDIKQLEDTEEAQIVYVTNISAFQMANSGNLPQNIFDIDKIIKEDLQMGTNMGQLMFQPQPGQRTATQASIGQSGLQLKASARVDVVEDFTVKVARRIAQLSWEYYDRDKVSEIIGKPVTENMWLDLPDDPKERRRILNSELIFRIDAGSTAPPKDETVDRKQWLDAVSIASSIAPERLKKDETLKSIFKTFKYIKDLDKIVIGFDEEETQSAMRENELMSQGAPQAVSPNENHLIHIQVHSQATPNELIDNHIAEHGKYLGVNPNQTAQQISKPQSGDRRPPMKSVAPEKIRESPPEEGDIYQSVQNLGVGTGEEAI